MEEKPKRARKPKVKSNALPVEQINELMFIHNKNDPQTGVQAVSGIDEKGKVQTVPADERNENSFLKFEKNSSILENFIKNFWSQLKEPTHFRLIRMTIHDYKQQQCTGKKHYCAEQKSKRTPGAGRFRGGGLENVPGSAAGMAEKSICV